MLLRSWPCSCSLFFLSAVQRSQYRNTTNLLPIFDSIRITILFEFRRVKGDYSFCKVLRPITKRRGKCAVTRPTSAVTAVYSLLDYGEEDEAYLYLDPKLRERADPAAAKARGPPREVVVFMIGGGCYSEYQNLQVR